MGMVLGLAAGTYAGTGGLRYDEALIPRFNIPKMSKPPTIDGTIDPAEWRESAKVMGMVATGGLEYKDRLASFRLAWDPQHLYLAYRVDTLTQPVPHLKRAHREKYAQGVVFDDALEVGLFLHDLNQLPNQVSSYFQCILNSLGCGEYTKSYPAIGQNMKNWTPTFDIANRTYTDATGKHWWEMEIAMDLQDLQMPRPFKAGDPVDIGLFADVKNPNWQWLDYPSASGHLEHYGFPRAMLTDDQAYIQVDEISGLHDRKLAYRSVVYNPTAKPVKVDARLLVQDGTKIKDKQFGELADPTDVINEQKVLEIPANGSARFDVVKDLPGLKAAGKGKGFLRLSLTPASGEQGRTAGRPRAAPVYTYACNFWGTDKSYVTPAEYKPYLDTRIAYNPANGLLQVSADTLGAPLPTGGRAAGATYKVSRRGQELKAGKLRYFVNQWYDDLVELGTLPPGKYDVALALVDAAGKDLANAKSGFEKKDEAKEFSTWWNSKIGDAEKLLKPFEALKVQAGKSAKTAVACVRRVYEFGSLGLPVQIAANGGPVLAAPARLVVKVGGKEYAVPTDKAVKVTGQKDWRVDFVGAPMTVAGVTFSAKGWMEQDGLVELALTYSPEKGGAAVEIEELRIEWPVAEDPLGAYMACMGQGGNYSARTIGAVPKGNGQVWNTKDDMGITGSGRRVGNFVGNLWVGTEQRGLLWCADSDRGWEPDARVAALALRRDGQRVLMVNNLIGSAAGKAACKLTEPRTVRFGYNVSPFKPLTPGFRLNSLSACGSFSGGKYKVNWDTKQEFFSVLSPPFSDPKRWPEYYAHCKDMVHKMMYEGMANDGGCLSFWPAPGCSAYYGDRRHLLFTANQIALRGYAWKSIENPNPYATFYGDWVDAAGRETLSRTYRDYMLWLMDRQVKEGGCQHFYFDISFGEVLHRNLAAGFGYRLPDGSVQPESSDTNLREWYKQVFAMMQENGLCPGGVSGHATHGFSLKMFPYADCILDSEYPMQDSIDVYPNDAMIALSCPHAFGTNIQHHGNFMNPTWPMMHDAAGLFHDPAFKQWGISRMDVEFIPYWRNHAVVKSITPGLIASLWKRPGRAGSAVIAIMNYGTDPAQPTRSASLKLDLKALGVPADALAAGGERVRIRQLFNCTAQNYYLRTLKWMAERQNKPLPLIEPKLDPAAGTISGFDINYHDLKILALDWEERPVNDEALRALAKDDAMRRRLLDWGLNAAAAVPANLIVADNPAVKVEAWKRTGDRGGRGNSVLLRLANTGDQEVKGTIKLDLKGLDVNVRKVWAEYTAAVPLDGKPVGLCESAAQPRNRGITYNAYDGEVYYSLAKGQSRVIAIDRY